MQRLFRHRSIRVQLTVIILLMVMVPLTIMFFLNRNYIQSRLYTQTRDTYATALAQTGSYLSDKAVLARNLLSMLYTDSHIQQGYDFFETSQSSENTAWLADLSSGRVTYKGSLLGSVSRLYFYQKGAVLDFRGDRLYASLSPEKRALFEDWYADSTRNSLFLTMPDSVSRCVYLLAKVPSARRLGSIIGLFQAELPIASFEQILQSAPVSGNCALGLYEAGEDVFLSTGSLQREEVLEGIAALPEMSGTDDVPLSDVRYNGEAYLAGRQTVEGTEWQLIMAVPLRDITAITSAADRILFIIMILLLALIIPSTSLITRRILKPVDRLREGVNAVSRGDYSVQVPTSGTAELDQVISSFNFMSRQTRIMMDEQYRMGRDLKNKELQLLQEQINPHFLYNTLDLLHWEARQADNREMADLIQALSQFYKLSLGHGEEIVTLDHELQHVEAYMRVQNIRFMNRIQLETDVPDALRHTHIVKMVLQPLVENSIQHGIREKADESGTIRIHAEAQGDFVLISVADDGVGMEEETVSGLLSSRHPGYGVYNVNDRLVLHYGSGAGLKFSSVPGQGTTVTLRIPSEQTPAVPEEPERRA